MKLHPQSKEPTSFLQGQELKLLSSYVSSHIGSLKQASTMADNVNTKYIDGGKGLPVIFLHGLGFNKSYFRSAMKRLSSLGYRTIAPEIPGIFPQLKLSNKKYNLRNLSAWLNDFTESLNLSSYILIGNCLGASLAAYHADAHPQQVEKLILLSMPETFNQHGQDIQTIIATQMINVTGPEDIEKLLSYCFYRPPELPEIVKKRIAKDILNNNEFVKQLLQDFGESQLQLYTKIKRIPHETLLITGENDPACPPSFGQMLEDQIKHSELHILGKSKHLTFIERHHLALKLIEDFLQA